MATVGCPALPGSCGAAGAQATRSALKAPRPAEPAPRSHGRRHLLPYLAGTATVVALTLAARLLGAAADDSQVARLPGLESSHVLRDTIRGDAESLGFEDVLNLPSEAAEAPKALLHDRTERLYGIGSGGPEII